MSQLSTMNAYEWINHRKGIIPSVLTRISSSCPEELALVSAGITGYGVARCLLAPYIGHLPPTGTSGDRPERDNWTLEWEFIRLAAYLGCEILGYKDEKKGEYIHQIIPVYGREDSRSNEGANLFEAHMEAPHLPEPPDMIMLTALKNSECSPTVIWPLEKFLALMTAHEKEIAFQPRFLVELGVSWGGGKFIEYPMLEYDRHGDLKLRLDLTSMSGKDSEAQALLDKFYHYCVKNDKELQNFEEILLAPGDVLLFDNRKNCHGRAPIPKVDIAREDRRWLHRVYLRRIES
ncbi:TPA: TauD/TfdA family dioxygenase [Serratia fonticola]